MPYFYNWMGNTYFTYNPYVTMDTMICPNNEYITSSKLEEYYSKCETALREKKKKFLDLE